MQFESFEKLGEIEMNAVLAEIIISSEDRRLSEEIGGEHWPMKNICVLTNLRLQSQRDQRP